MQTETIKTILLCKDAIIKSREIMVETLEKLDRDEMTDNGRRDVFYIGVWMKTLKADLDCFYFDAMKKARSASEENEIENAVEEIENILKGDELENTNLV